MTNDNPSIVVLTPVKNEEWILHRFLSVTSQFADHIIVADQSSTDNSPEICRTFPKVTLIKNEGKEYSEDERQRLLIRKARQIVPGPRILLALDADEILAATAPGSPGWETMRKAPPGTVLCFEQVELYRTPERCLRSDLPWPLGFVDDGSEHAPRPIHSIRIPVPDAAPRLSLFDVKVLHYARVRLSAQASKTRFYSILENVLGTIPSPLKRRVRYDARANETRGVREEACPPEWFGGWEKLGIDMRSIPGQKFNYQDFEALRLFGRYGTRRFWLDDIWDFDWEACRRYARSEGLEGIPDQPIAPPPLPAIAACRLLTGLYRGAMRAKRSLYIARDPLHWR